MPGQDIIGHERQREELERDIEADNVAHAYLFEGPPHIGKFTIARWFALQLLLRDAPLERCQRIVEEADRMLHPDLLVLDKLWIAEQQEDWEAISRSSNVPQEHRKKAGARTDTIGIDDVRYLHDRLYGTGSGRHRVCCIRSVERMQDPAANALLKILEEPPEGRVFLLTTTSVSALLPPVVSRTRVLRFQCVPDRGLAPLIAGLPDDDARFLRHMAQGAPGIICKFRENAELLRAERQLHERAAAVWQAPLVERLELLLPLSERSEEAERFLLHLALTLRELPATPAQWSDALHQLVRGLETNAHRSLLTERFALQLGG
jgi:DNA polymerase III subunit delta'